MTEETQASSSPQREVDVKKELSAMPFAEKLLAGAAVAMLLAVLTCGTEGRLGQLAGCWLQAPSTLAVGQDPGPHQKLHLLEGQVPKSIVPAQKFFLGRREVHVGMGHC